MEARTVGEQIRAAADRLNKASIESPLLDTQIMMARVLGCSRLSVIAHPERVLFESEQIAFESMVDKRAGHCPLAYITGHREFYGLDFHVEPGVLIPRPETEILVDACADRLKAESPVIADIGVGSGAIAVALAVTLPSAVIYGTDISDAALKVAGVNVEKHDVAEQVTLMKGDLLEPLKSLGLRLDAVVSNPPYIPTADLAGLQPEVRLYEPVGALDGGEDGLNAYRRLLPDAYELLSDSGFVAVEIGIGEPESVVEIAREAGYRRTEVIDDLAGIPRVVIAYK